MNTKVSIVFSIIAAVLLFAASPVIATHEAFAATTPTVVNPPTTVVNPCPVNTVWLGGNTCQLVTNGGYGSGFGHGFHHH
jgi:hypothetical protein